MIITQEVFMEIRNLESFIQVAELGSFTKAAESLGYTQSSVSTQIRQLEKSLASLYLNGSTTESGLQKKEKRS